MTTAGLPDLREFAWLWVAWHATQQHCWLCISRDGLGWVGLYSTYVITGVSKIAFLLYCHTLFYLLFLYSCFAYIRQSLKFRFILLPWKERAMSPWGEPLRLCYSGCIFFYYTPLFWYIYLLIKCCLADCSLRHYTGHPSPNIHR